MVYKKYIKRDGKVFGPYYCESYRDEEGKVKTRFISGPKKTKEKLFVLLLIVLLVIFIGGFVYNVSYYEEKFLEEEGLLYSYKKIFSLDWVFKIDGVLFEPLGIEEIGLEVLYPIDLTKTLNVTQNEFFNVTLEVSCVSGNCGYINTSLAYDIEDCYNNLKDPIPICTCNDLNRIREDLTANYALQNNIDCSDTINWDSGLGFEPIGRGFSLNNAFKGTLDGQNFKIINLFIKRDDEDYVGLFGLGYGFEVRNIVLENESISGRSDVGGLIGYNVEGVILNSYFIGIVNGSGAVGGLVGRAYNGVLENSYFKGNISGKEFVGGLIGHNQGFINNSYFIGNITGGDYVGGLIAYSEDSNISSSYSVGNITGGDYVGGLVGYLSFDDATPSIYDSYFRGNVTGEYRVGGLVGMGSAIINNSYSVGNVSGVGYVGGLVGFNTYRIENSYSTSKVIAAEYTGGVVPLGYGIKGALVGYNHAGYSPITIKKSFFLQYNGDVCVGLNLADPGNTDCTEKTSEDYFYDIDNDPMTGWDFPPWSVINDDIDYLILSWMFKEINAWVLGLVSTRIGAVPFYTNVSNPNTSSTLNSGESEIIIFWVNATGYMDSTYKFFAYSNMLSDLSVEDITEKWDVRIMGVTPNITLLSPDDESSFTTSSQLVNFEYKVNATNPISNCSLIINNIINLTNFSIEDLSILQSFSQTFAPGSYDWGINCTDSIGNSGNSSVRSFAVNAPGGNGNGGNGGNGNGGGGDPIVKKECIENWTCGNWSECINKKQVRNCTDLKNCKTNLTKPGIVKACGIEEEVPSCDDGMQSQDEEGIDCGGSCEPCIREFPFKRTMIYVIIAIILLVIIVILVLFRKKLKKLLKKKL